MRVLLLCGMRGIRKGRQDGGRVEMGPQITGNPQPAGGDEIEQDFDYVARVRDLPGGGGRDRFRVSEGADDEGSAAIEVDFRAGHGAYQELAAGRRQSLAFE